MSDDDNKLQKGIAGMLEKEKRAGIVKKYRLNCIRFRVGEQDPLEQIREGTWYKPDFYVVMVAPGPIHILEAKGMWREAAKVRFKACAEIYPEYIWEAVYQDGPGYRREVY